MSNDFEILTSEQSEQYIIMNNINWISINTSDLQFKGYVDDLLISNFSDLFPLTLETDKIIASDYILSIEKKLNIKNLKEEYMNQYMNSNLVNKYNKYIEIDKYIAEIKIKICNDKCVYLMSQGKLYLLFRNKEEAVIFKLMN